MMKLFKKGKLGKNEESFYKQRIREFFEGNQKEKAPIVKIPVLHFGITDIKFKKHKSYIEITIELERPGMLIGGNGKIVGKLCKYLTVDENIKINAVESKLWK